MDRLVFANSWVEKTLLLRLSAQWRKYTSWTSL
jgi:hypothetical protein